MGIGDLPRILSKRGKEKDDGSRRNQSLFDADLTLLHDGERVSFAEGVHVHGI